jgi:hypothetical protein
MESYTRDGHGQVTLGKQAIPIKTIHDRHWQNYDIQVASPGGRQYLRFSPCNKPGTTQIASMQLIGSDGKAVMTWDFGTNKQPAKKATEPQKTANGWIGGTNGHLKLSS